MTYRIVMPKIDANIEEGTVGPWRLAPGERFEKGDALVEIITDKATFELEAEQPGLLRRIVAEEKSTVPVGYVLALATAGPDEPVPEVEEENRRILEAFHEKAGLADAAPSPAPAAPKREQPAAPAPRVRATPAARRLARKSGLDLAEVPNPEGKVIGEKDVEDYLAGRSGGSDA
jgi:pyruvate/2-oxoglutarate dehydrogenase complex dihydrolipoamide acyltransferase (E2) component